MNGNTYVGKANVPQKRRYSHFNGSCNEHLKRAIKLYGVDNFTFDVIEEYTSEDTAYEAETRMIRRLRAMGIVLYNQNDGGVGGYNPTPEVRQKIRQAYRRDADTLAKRSKSIRRSKSDPNKRVLYNEAAKVVNNTPEAKERHHQNAVSLWADTTYQEKQRSARLAYHTTGVRRSRERQRPKHDRTMGYVITKSLDDVIVNTYASLSAASHSVSGNRKLLRECCNSIRDHAYGFQWKKVML